MSENVELLILGIIVLFILGIVVALLLGLVSYLKELNDNRISRRNWKIRETELRVVGQRIRNESHWFSENDAARAMLKVLGDQLHEFGYSGRTSDLRSSWRLEFEKMNNKREDFE